MRAVVQRVIRAEVTVDTETVAQIGSGLLVYASFEQDDGAADLKWMREKLLNLRIFADPAGKMNRSVLEVSGELLVVSNFTLHGDARKGRRPSFATAAPELLMLVRVGCADRTAELRAVPADESVGP